MALERSQERKKNLRNNLLLKIGWPQRTRFTLFLSRSKKNMPLRGPMIDPTYITKELKISLKEGWRKGHL